MKISGTQKYIYSSMILLVIPVLNACGGLDYQWGWYEISPITQRGISNLKFLAGGLGVTIALTLISIGCSIGLGLFVALPGLSKKRYLRALNRIYVEIFRSIPVLVMILWVYYGMPMVLGISLDPFAAGVVSLAISDSAFEAEIFRGGIQSIERGLTEAADSQGFSYIDKMRFIVLPLAMRRILPPLGNQFVYMLIMSSLVSIIGLQELTRKANELTVSIYRPLEIYTVLVIEYLLLIIIVSRLVRKLEVKMGANVQLAG